MSSANSQQPRMMMYSQDGLGLGHMRRTTSIANQIVRARSDAAILTMADSRLGQFFESSANHDYLKLPSIVKAGPGDWRAVSLPLSFESVSSMRRELIRSAVLSGAGDLDIKTATAPDSFSARLSGSGNLTVDNVQARAVDLITTGAGDILARGTAEAMAARLSGAGSLDARGLQVKDADIRLSGAGDVHANVSGTARGVLTGVGSIDVEGPAKCAIARTGVGDVRCGGDTDTGAGE